MITSFRDKYRFLSNFAYAPVWFDDNQYPSVEHAYQAAKTTDPELRQKIRECETAGKAKRLGKTAPLGPHWTESFRLNLMEDLLRQKFNHNHFKKLLLQTETMFLCENNTWGDKFWGVCNGEGCNWLGQLLMKVREELKANEVTHGE